MVSSSNNKIRIVNERPGDRHLLPHPGGERLIASIQKRLHVERARQLVDALPQCRRLHSVQAAVVQEHFARGEPPVKPGVAGDKPDAPPDFERVFCEILPVAKHDA